MRRLLIIATALTLLGGSAYASERPAVSDTRHARVGEVLFLKLPGNPSAGYKWRLNEASSEGLELVSVDQVGWILAPESRSIFFRKHSILNVSVLPKAPGRAELAFDYYRPYGKDPMVKTTVVRVLIEPPDSASR